MQQQWKSIMLFVLAAGILCVGIWMVADGNLNGLAAILFGAFNVLIAILESYELVRLWPHITVSKGTVSCSATCSPPAPTRRASAQRRRLWGKAHPGRSSGPALVVDEVGDLLEDERSDPGEGDVAVAGLGPDRADADDQT